MNLPPRFTRRSLVELATVALLLTLTVWLWIAVADRDVLASIGPEVAGATQRTTEHPTSTSSMQPGDFEPLAGLVAPEVPGRHVVELGGGAMSAVEVFVRADDTSAPIADCELIYIDRREESEARFMERFRQRGLDLEWLRHRGQRTATDAQGRARIVCQRGELTLIAVSATHWGMDQVGINTPERRVNIDCKPMRFLDVQVIDSGGRPLNRIPVCLVTKAEVRSMPFGRSGLTRAPDGIARLGPIQTDEGDHWNLRVLGTLHESTRLDLDLGALPAEPIQIVMPDWGAVEVRLVPLDGKALLRNAEVALRSARDGDQFLCSPNETVRPGATSAVFEHVELGLELFVELTIEGRVRAFKARGPGPRTAGQTVVIEVPFDITLPRLTAQLVDAAGKPLRDRRVHVDGAMQVGEETIYINAHPRSDRAGRIVFEIEAPAVVRAPANLLIWSMRPEPVLGAALEIEVSTGTVDLGALVLSAPNLLASGRLVDKDGVGLSRIELHLQRPRRPEGYAWGDRSRSGANGDFELRGWCKEPTLRITAEDRGDRVQESQLEVQSGSTGIHWVLHEPAATRHR